MRACRMEAVMRDFTFLIHDQRYSVPTLQLVSVPNPGVARELASARLAASPEHLAVDVLEDGVLLFRVGAPTEAGLALLPRQAPELLGSTGPFS